ncbi:MAG: hypothetical protein SFX73_31100 [Kofleriaceae bacterium]|nr:hypothetical protein [Kofleriaceae bacterium]
MERIDFGCRLALALAIALAIVLALGALAPANADPRDNDDEAPAYVRVNVPHVRTVIAAAYRAARLDRDVGRSFVRRARLAGLVPWLSVRTARDTTWRDLQPDVGRSTTMEVRATWRLDRLLFEPRELQVASLEAVRRRERRRLANLVIRLYFAWKQADGPLRAEELAAELDALTDGWFGKAVENQEATSGCRTGTGASQRMP